MRMFVFHWMTVDRAWLVMIFGMVYGAGATDILCHVLEWTAHMVADATSAEVILFVLMRLFSVTE